MRRGDRVKALSLKAERFPPEGKGANPSVVQLRCNLERVSAIPAFALVTPRAKIPAAVLGQSRGV